MPALVPVLLPLLFILLLLSMPALSTEEKVYVVKLHYNSDGFTVKEVAVRDGFAPDRTLQSGAYRAELITDNNKVVYGFNFEVPLLLFTDGNQGGKVRGSVVKLNESDFVLVVPFYDGASLRIADSEKQYVASLSPETVTRRLVKMGLWMAAGGIILIGFMLIRKRMKGQPPEDYGNKENPYQMPPGNY